MTGPVIAVVGGTVNAAVNFSSRQIVCSVAEAVLQLVTDHGGVPVILPDCLSPQAAKALSLHCDGLLLPPGRDVDPAHYGADPKVTYVAVEGVGEPWRRPRLMAPDPRRDLMEIALFDAMTQAQKPILGLCRGMQIINVARGGTLHQELPQGTDHFVETDGWIPYHGMAVTPGSHLAKLVTVDQLIVSSVHHQGIDKLGHGLSVAGRAPDGVIEAIEDSSNSFVFGLQSHPEKTRRNFPELERLFAAFIAAARQSHLPRFFPQTVSNAHA